MRISETPEWQALAGHQGEIGRRHLRELFAEEPDRGGAYTARAGDLHLDYSKNRLTGETVRLLAALADRAGLRERTEAMFTGRHINSTEDRAVLHVALRDPATSGLVVDGHDVNEQVHEVLGRMAGFADRVRGGEWTGHNGERIRAVVNIGIGGSDLGPAGGPHGLAGPPPPSPGLPVVSHTPPPPPGAAPPPPGPRRTPFIIASD